MRKFMRTRPAPELAPSPAPAPPPAPRLTPLPNGHPKTNGHANGGARRDDSSTLSGRHWSGAGSAELWEDVEFPVGARAVGDRRLASGLVWKRPYDHRPERTILGDDKENNIMTNNFCNQVTDHAQAIILPAIPSTSTSKTTSGLNPHMQELSAAPVFLGADADDSAWEVEVGALGSGALCAAAAALAPTPRLLARVAPPHSLRDHYTGACTFRFWVFGSWREVVVDDRLPCRGAPPRLLASRARPHDYTLPLLEKAYAKLYGSYAAMRAAGAAPEGCARALQELTGGIVQSFSLARQPQPLTLQVLHSAAPRSTIIVASRAEKESGWRRGGGGLVTAYVVTGLARVRGGAALVRVRGRGAWRGAWARGSAEWRALADVDRDALDARALHSDEFWISFSDFASVFARLELVHVGPDDWVREPALHARRPWRAVLARRRWRRGFNAGGPPEATETTGTNPQFHVSIPGCAGAGAGAGAGKCHVVVSVLQHYCPRGPARLRAVGFALYELPPGGAAPRSLGGLRPLDVTHCSRAREVATFFTLPAGEYLLVPHARRAHAEQAFLLRVLTDQHADIWEVNEDNLIVRDISSEFPDERQPLPPEVRAALVKLFGKEEVEEVDAELLRGALRRGGLGRAPRALCRALVALRDARVAGRMCARDVPALLRVLAGWRAVWARHASCGRASSYRVRAMLRQAGVHASNKVLEGCVVRFARKAQLAADAFLLALARIYLAHERYRLLDTKLKSNPLSLEEMILMTIYS